MEVREKKSFLPVYIAPESGQETVNVLRTQVVNVSGRRFEMTEGTWKKILSKMPKLYQSDLHDTGPEIYVSRHPAAFQCIMYYRQGEELHLPVEMCPSSFRREIDFWGVEDTELAKCCSAKYISYFDDHTVLQTLDKDQLEKKTEKQLLMTTATYRTWPGLKARMWLTMNEPFYSKASRIYFTFSAALILISLFALVAGTHPYFQRSLGVEEWQEYFGADWHKYERILGFGDPEGDVGGVGGSNPEAEIEPGSEPEAETEPEVESDVQSEPESRSGTSVSEPNTYTPETTITPEPDSSTPETMSTPETETTSQPETNSEPETEKQSDPEKSSSPEAVSDPEANSESESVPLPENAFVQFVWLNIIEYICVTLFTLDLLVRYLFCPSRDKLLVSFLHWVDVFALSVMYLKYVVEELYPQEKYRASPVDILHCLQVVRVFRLFRLVKNFIGFRVLLFAFKASAKEMLLMSMFLAIAMLIFSTCVYFSGDLTFTNIPDAFWWSIVTMTTVGYGDVVPQTMLSKTIGAVCAVCGVCLLAIIIPIFVNNFMMFYSYSKIWRKLDEKQNESKHTEVKGINGDANCKKTNDDVKVKEVNGDVNNTPQQYI